MRNLGIQLLHILAQRVHAATTLVKPLSVRWQPVWAELTISSCISAVMLAPGHIRTLRAMLE